MNYTPITLFKGLDANNNEKLYGLTWPSEKTDFVMDGVIGNFANAVLVAGGKYLKIGNLEHKAKTLMLWGAKEPVVSKSKKLTKRY